jgi:hypothetical protein
MRVTTRRQHDPDFNANSRLSALAWPRAPWRHAACSVPAIAAKSEPFCPVRGQRQRQKRPATEQVAMMRHSSTRDVFAYWNERRGERPAPERADIDPVAIRHALGDIFILAADFVDEQRFRLGGTRVCALFCRELKGEPFGALWDEPSRRLIQNLLNVIAEENLGAVAGVTGHAADGAKVNLELLLLPLAHQGHARVRALGVLVPIGMPYWIGEKPVTALELGQIRHVGPAIDELGGRRFVTGGPGVRVRRGLMIYQGGRDDSPSEKAG